MRRTGLRGCVRRFYHWHLRRVMAEHGMFATLELVPRLVECGVRLSREQVYRLGRTEGAFGQFQS